MLERAVRNSIFTGLGTVSTFVLGFVFAGLTIRYLGEARAGYLLALQALIGLNALVGGLGLSTPSLRRIAYLYAQGDLSRARAVVGSVTTVNAATGLLFSLLVVLFFPTIFVWSRLDPIYREDAFWATLFVAGSFLVSQITSSWQVVYEAAQRYDLTTILTTVFGLLLGISGIMVLSIAPSMSAVAATGFIISLIRLSSDAYFLQRILRQVPLPTWMWSEIRPMLGFGGWTYIGSLGGFLFTNLDRLILTTFLGSAALPYYVVPQRLYLQIHTALSNQCRFLFPMLSAWGDQAAAQIERVEDRLRWFVALVSGAVYTSLAFIGPDILSRLVSPEFARQATLPLVLVCIQGFFNAQNIVPYFSSWAIGAGAPNAVAQLLNGVLVGLTAVWLIPRFGFVGASLAQLWIIIVVIAHTLWVSYIISKAPLWRWLYAYISPILMVILWFCIVETGKQFITSGVAFYLLVLVGGIAGLGIVGLIEQVIFPAKGRWVTLKQAIAIPFNRLRTAIVFLSSLAL